MQGRWVTRVFKADNPGYPETRLVLEEPLFWG